MNNKHDEAQENKPGKEGSTEVEHTTISSKRSPTGLGDMVEDKVHARTPDAENQHKHYLTEELVRVFIPRDQNEPKNVLHAFCINGFKFGVPKGRYVHVPQSVADLISEAYEQLETMLNEHPKSLKNNKDAEREFSR